MDKEWYQKLKKISKADRSVCQYFSSYVKIFELDLNLSPAGPIIGNEVILKDFFSERSIV